MLNPSETSELCYGKNMSVIEQMITYFAHRLFSYAFNNTGTFTFYLSILNMEHFKTEHGKRGILYEGFRFRKDRDSKTANLWRCVKKLAFSKMQN